jgi:hypothetical protein
MMVEMQARNAHVSDGWPSCSRLGTSWRSGSSIRGFLAQFGDLIGEVANLNFLRRFRTLEGDDVTFKGLDLVHELSNLLVQRLRISPQTALACKLIVNSLGTAFFRSIQTGRS